MISPIPNIDDAEKRVKHWILGSTLLSILSIEAAADEYPQNLLWGDTHLHTPYSFDAFLNGNYDSEPSLPYRWAKGEPVIHPFTRTRVQIETPLDFIAVSDHAESLGFTRGIVTGDAILTDVSLWNSLKRWFMVRYARHTVENNNGPELFKAIMPRAPHGDGNPIEDSNNTPVDAAWGDPTPTVRSSWAMLMDAVDTHYVPGEFTTMVGWEWTSTPTGANLHRVVISPSSGEQAKVYLPFGWDQSQYPEDLWTWLQSTEKRIGVPFLSIPHNSNISKGYMFPLETMRGKPISAEYAKLRMKYEPVVEITQIKGDSETHPALSPDDEFADFETYQYYLQSSEASFSEALEGDYVRSALKTGMQIQNEIGVNPYKFGMIGSTDAHTSISSAEEHNFWGKMGIDALPQNKVGEGTGGIPTATGWDMAAAGLVAVWANENTREEIFSAFKRREVYATTGPRITVRFFGGWAFEDLGEHGQHLVSQGYSHGVPMGSDLPQRKPDSDAPPTFLIHAMRDPKGANLDRIQVIKITVASNGKAEEQIYDVSWSDGRVLDETGKLPPVGNTVNRSTGRVENSIGAPELMIAWRDPDFSPSKSALYYVRVLQIPTARHSYLDAMALNVEHPLELPEVIQERAYSSPIWYTPNQPNVDITTDSKQSSVTAR